MRRTSLLAACLAAVPVIVSAHGGIPGAPKIFGRHPLAQIKARNVFESPMEKHGAIPTGPHLDPRANIDGQCGAQYGSCAAGYCCSSAGYCGKGPEYCNSPDCQFNYGPGCDANKTPAGVSTASIARPKLGNVLYGGAGIYDCTVPGTIALTYDDGPYIYTSDILDILKSYNAKATFFMTGINNGKGEIDNASTIYPAIIKRAYAEGHQIASHTWSHQDLSAITQQQRKDQMYKQERALANILGFFPTYMRPPYSSCNGPCQTDMGTLGYHISYFDVDTDDYDNDSPTLIQNSKNNFVNGIAGGTPQNNDYLVIGHDIHEQTAHNLTAFMLDQIKSRGYRAVTMGECMGDGPSNWYRSVGGAPASTPVSTVVTPVKTSTSTIGTGSTSAVPTSTTTARIISPDATCGGTTNYTCAGSAFGSCCSVNGWCGATDAYCGNGCNALFGTCNNGASVTVSSSVVRKTSSQSSTVKYSTSATIRSSSTLTKSTLKSTTSNHNMLPSPSTTPESCTSTIKSSSPFHSTSSSSKKTTRSSSTKQSLPNTSTPVVKSSATSTSTKPATSTPVSSLPKSSDGSCGTQATCQGSTFGNCCSQYGWCGSTAAYCGTGCQSAYGSCT